MRLWALKARRRGGGSGFGVIGMIVAGMLAGAPGAWAQGGGSLGQAGPPSGSGGRAPASAATAAGVVDPQAPDSQAIDSHAPEPEAIEPQALELAKIRDWVRFGDPLRVTDAGGRRLEGTLAGFSQGDGALLLRRKDGIVRLPAAEVQRVELEVNDSLKNGALEGMVTAFGIAALTSLACGSGDYFLECLGWTSMWFVPVGAGLGVGIDAMVNEHRVVYRAEGSPFVPAALAPVVAPGRAGVALTWRW